ncbi:hypothetical protein CA235_07420 [Sphingomonas sp. ABOLF]|nr:hypothetical protein CA235_07420 [Sphingomonas sp. ABOLF]
MQDLSQGSERTVPEESRMIPWRPIAELPDALKDGQEVLLWETVVEGRAEFAVWSPSGPAFMPASYHLAHGVWCDREGATIHGITHFAEITSPR